jgi:nicotinamide mononucleotide (NMN) deamidase PncC
MSASLTKLSASAEAVNRAFSIMKSGMIVGDTTGLTALSDALKGFTGFTVDANLPALINSLKQLSKLVLPDDLGAKLGDIGSALRSFSGFTVDPNLPMLISLLQKVSKVNIPPDLGTQLIRLGMALAAFGSITAGLAAVDRSLISFINALARLGGVDFASASIGLPIFTRAISDLIAAVSAGGGVDRSLISLISALTRLARATTTASGAVSNLNLNIGRTPMHTRVAHQGYNNLYMMLIKFRTLLWGLRTAWRALSSSISDASSLVEVANVVGTVYSDSARQQLEQLSHDAIQNYGMSELAFKQMASRFQAMGTAMGISNEAVAGAEENFKKWNLANKATGDIYGVMTGNMSDMSMTLTELAADIGSFYDTSVEDVQTALSAVYTGQTRPLRQFG